MARVSIEVRGLEDVKRLVSDLGSPNVAISRAINKGLAKARTAAWSEVKPLFPISQSQFYSKLTAIKSSPLTLFGRLSASRTKFSYIDVGGATQQKKGVRVQPRKGARKVAIGALLGATRTGKKTIYKPKSGAAGVEQIVTFSAAQMVDDPPGRTGNALDRAQTAAYEAYEKELMRQIDLIAARK